MNANVAGRGRSARFDVCVGSIGLFRVEKMR